MMPIEPLPLCECRRLTRRLELAAILGGAPRIVPRPIA
jgi:hypothetical protein